MTWPTWWTVAKDKEFLQPDVCNHEPCPSIAWPFRMLRGTLSRSSGQKEKKKKKRSSSSLGPAWRYGPLNSPRSALPARKRCVLACAPHANFSGDRTSQGAPAPGTLPACDIPRDPMEKHLRPLRMASASLASDPSDLHIDRWAPTLLRNLGHLIGCVSSSGPALPRLGCGFGSVLLCSVFAFWPAWSLWIGHPQSKRK